MFIIVFCLDYKHILHLLYLFGYNQNVAIFPNNFSSRDTAYGFMENTATYPDGYLQIKFSLLNVLIIIQNHSRSRDTTYSVKENSAKYLDGYLQNKFSL